jgi:cytochrome c oxidase cbb3-type subunit I/II
MPNYPWLLTNPLDLSTLAKKLSVQRTLGVPYAPMTDTEVASAVGTQAAGIVADLAQPGTDIKVQPDREIIALIAYLQKLGKYERVQRAVAKP